MDSKHFPLVDEIASAIADSEKPEDHAFAAAFRVRQKEADSDSWGLLSQVFHFHFTPSKVDEPFSPMMVMGGKRSLVPEDLSEDQLTELEATLDIISDPEYVARIADILWLTRRDPARAREAVCAYVLSAERVEDLNHWPSSMKRYERAIRLAKQIEPKDELPKTVLTELEARAIAYGGNDPLYFSHRAFELLSEFKFGDSLALAQLAQNIGDGARELGDFRRARKYFDVQSKLLRNAKMMAESEAAKVMIVECLIEEAEAREVEGSAMVARSFWQDAIKECREIPTLKDRIPELQKRLSSAGDKLVDDMQERSHKIDLSNCVKDTLQKLTGLSWEDAFFHYISGEPILSKPELCKEAEETIKNSPLQAMIATEMFDASGRKVGVRPSAMTDDKEQYETALSGFVEWHANLHRGVVVHGRLLPGLEKLREDHSVTASAVISLIEDSPFIPPGRKTLFYQGITSGFNLDFSTALHILVPQVENALRQLLHYADVEPFRMDASGVQKAWSYPKILSHEKTSEIIGPNLVFELQSLLIERLGQNIRNLLAHGLIEPRTLNGDSAIYLWWIFLRLVVCLSPGMHAYLERMKEKRDS